MKKSVQADLKGQVCIVTGANTGMGKITALELARLGAQVILACRDAARGEAARIEIVAQTANPLVTVGVVDLSSLASVESFAAAFLKAHRRLDVLVNNAGAWWMDRRESVDGIELQWATNVLGPHHLTQLLLPALKASGKARIVNVASTAAGGLDLTDVEFKSRKYSGAGAYSASKQANRMLSWAWAERLSGTGVAVNALSPGLVSTEFNRNAEGFFKVLFAIFKPMSKKPEEGADTAVWLAASPEAEGFTDQFWENRKSVPCKFRDPVKDEALWQVCEGQLEGR